MSKPLSKKWIVAGVVVLFVALSNAAHYFGGGTTSNSRPTVHAKPASEPRRPEAATNSATAAPVERPIGWRADPRTIVVEMAERFEQLEKLHQRARQLPQQARRDGLESAGQSMRALRDECRAADADYRLRFGQLVPWPDFDATSMEGRAHVAMGFALANVCGTCATLLPGADAACRGAEEPMRDASSAIKNWKSAIAKPARP
jgi:hypothetical protein